MPYPFAEIAFTEAVKRAQAENGSRDYCEKMAENERDFRLGPDERAFLAAQDHFFMATVSETGWPYVQHRGGPPGFVHVLDEDHFAFPDFRGNRQYVSVGNLAGDDRAAFFFIDYPHKSRLKALGRVSLHDTQSRPDVIARFKAMHYRALVERVFVVEVAALDWNCPQHITERFTAAELTPVMGKLIDELEALKQENAALKARLGEA
jgi:predicted pyridoxine 5'-phosphate oxidase superfamily flavin-nucleotide-binding protein